MLKLIEYRQVLGQTSSTSPSQTAKKGRKAVKSKVPKRNCESAKSVSECFTIKEASSSVRGISKFKLNFIERQGSRWAPGVTSWHCYDMTCLFSSRCLHVSTVSTSFSWLSTGYQSHLKSMSQACQTQARIGAWDLQGLAAWHWISMERRAHACTGWMIIPNAEETSPPNSDCTQIQFYFDYFRFSKDTWTGSEKAPIAIAGSGMLLQTSSWLQQAHTISHTSNEVLSSIVFRTRRYIPKLRMSGTLNTSRNTS